MAGGLNLSPNLIIITPNSAIQNDDSGIFVILLTFGQYLLTVRIHNYSELDHNVQKSNHSTKGCDFYSAEFNWDFRNKTMLIITESSPVLTHPRSIVILAGIVSCAVEIGQYQE